MRQQLDTIVEVAREVEPASEAFRTACACRARDVGASDIHRWVPPRVFRLAPCKTLRRTGLFLVRIEQEALGDVAEHSTDQERD